MTATVCPRCNHPRQGATRFCTNCAFDYWKGAEPPSQSGAPTPVTTATAATRSRVPLFVGGALVLLIGAGAVMAISGQDRGQGLVAAPDESGPSASEAATARPTPNRTPNQEASDCVNEGGRWSSVTDECTFETPAPAETPQPALTGVGIGETVTITCGDDDCLEVTVTDPSFHEVYVDPDGFYNDEPQVPGYVYMQVFVEYVSLQDAATFNLFDWQVFVDGRLVDDYAFAINGPEPTLGSGQLPTGRTASGWLVYEVPATGEVVLAYAPNFDGPPVFEMTLRR